MPINTRVGRCVQKLQKRYKYGVAIGICQKSTKQNYLTGKTIRRRRSKRKTRKVARRRKNTRYHKKRTRRRRRR